MICKLMLNLQKFVGEANPQNPLKRFATAIQPTIKEAMELHHDKL